MIRSGSPAGAGKRTDWHIPTTASTNSTGLTTSANKAPRLTAPATDTANGIFVFSDPEITDSILIGVGFLITDANNETASAAVWGWQQTTGGNFIPRLLCTLTVTAGARTGVSGHQIAATDYIADTIAVVVDNTVRTVNVTTPTDGLAVAEIDHYGSDYIEVEVTTNSGTAASVKPIVRGI